MPQEVVRVAMAFAQRVLDDSREKPLPRIGQLGIQSFRGIGLGGHGRQDIQVVDVGKTGATLISVTPYVCVRPCFFVREGLQSTHCVVTVRAAGQNGLKSHTFHRDARFIARPAGRRACEGRKPSFTPSSHRKYDPDACSENTARLAWDPPPFHAPEHPSILPSSTGRRLAGFAGRSRHGRTFTSGPSSGLRISEDTWRSPRRSNGRVK